MISTLRETDDTLVMTNARIFSESFHIMIYSSYVK